MNAMPARRAVVSWSGGKDSCLAAHLAREAGVTIEALFCMVEPDADRSRSHALPRWMLEAHAAAMGVPLVVAAASWKDYEATFVAQLEKFRAQGIDEVVFGDIDLVPHREWEEKVCTRAGLVARLPLWEWPRSRVVEAVFERDIRAVCVCVNTRFMPGDFCGRTYDREFVAALPAGVDACGENGEFHTCVLDAPAFAQPIAATAGERRTYTAPPEYGGDTFVFAGLSPRDPV